MKKAKRNIAAGELVEWLRGVCQARPAVVAVSGGVDSAVALTLGARALGAERVTAVLLPYGEQAMDDAREVVEWNGVGSRAYQIKNAVAAIEQETGELAPVRRGNVMARVRMIYLYDVAKELGGLVLGTENKSEHYLGYFTRYGDQASDVEPLLGLYKTEVWKLAEELGLPGKFVSKRPSAGLWEGQTDEGELGFGYVEADKVLKLLIDEGVEEVEELAARLAGEVKREVVERVVGRVRANAFKREVPYQLTR